MAAQLQQIIDLLEKHYGKPDPPVTTDPFELVLWENVVYLADDARREKAFRLLESRVGLDPQKILDAPREVLFEVSDSAGILPDTQVEKLLDIANITQQRFHGDLKTVVKLPLKQAVRALRFFPSIGEPGAEKILLFSHSYPVPALESNGMRALVRLGFGKEMKSYTATYKLVREAITPQIKPDCDWLIGLHQLLRRHGQQLCKRASPLCAECPLKESCAYVRTST